MEQQLSNLNLKLLNEGNGINAADQTLVPFTEGRA